MGMKAYFQNVIHLSGINDIHSGSTDFWKTGNCKGVFK
jgi:hypothetical protein